MSSCALFCNLCVAIIMIRFDIFFVFLFPFLVHFVVKYVVVFECIMGMTTSTCANSFQSSRPIVIILDILSFLSTNIE